MLGCGNGVLGYAQQRLQRVEGANKAWGPLPLQCPLGDGYAWAWKCGGV